MSGSGSFGETVPFALWLVPEEQDRGCLEGIISRLSEKYDAPVFPPHVTMFAGVRVVQEGLEDIVAGVMEGCGPITLKTKGLGFADSYFKTVFVTFEDEPALQEMAEKIGMALNRSQAYVVRPHLSLIYKVLPDEMKRTIIKSVDFDAESVRFDEICVVTPGPTKSWADVGQWQIQFHKSL